MGEVDDSSMGICFTKQQKPSHWNNVGYEIFPESDIFFSPIYIAGTA